MTAWHLSVGIITSYINNNRKFIWFTWWTIVVGTKLMFLIVLDTNDSSWCFCLEIANLVCVALIMFLRFLLSLYVSSSRGFGRYAERKYREFFCWVLYMCPWLLSTSLLGAHGAVLSIEIRLLSGETLLQEKNSTSYRWESKPGLCR